MPHDVSDAMYSDESMLAFHDLLRITGEAGEGIRSRKLSLVEIKVMSSFFPSLLFGSISLWATAW